jgi:hypothetical protein
MQQVTYRRVKTPIAFVHNDIGLWLKAWIRVAGVGGEGGLNNIPWYVNN